MALMRIELAQVSQNTATAIENCSKLRFLVEKQEMHTSRFQAESVAKWNEHLEQLSNLNK
jgi:hypothetical protein